MINLFLTNSLVRLLKRDPGGLDANDIIIGLVEYSSTQLDYNKDYLLNKFFRAIPQAQAVEDVSFLIDYILEIDVTFDSFNASMSRRRI